VVRPHDGSGEDRWSRLESAAQSPDRPFSLVRATGAEGFRISAPAQLATAVSPVLGSPWREILPDTSMSATRAASIGVVGPWIDKCTDAGFGAAERDSLDSAGRVHDRGLAVGRKYACHSVGGKTTSASTAPSRMDSRTVAKRFSSLLSTILRNAKVVRSARVSLRQLLTPRLLGATTARAGGSAG
jgi:hypothetical protein